MWQRQEDDLHSLMLAEVIEEVYGMKVVMSSTL